MNLAWTQRRLLAGMALAALLAFGAGAGLAAPGLVAAAVALGAATVWQPSAAWSGWWERGARMIALVLLVWIGYVAFVTGGDFFPPILAMLLFLVASEALRPAEAQNELRLYALSFALLIAASAYRPGSIFAVAFVGYIALTTLALMVGHLRRRAEEHGIAHIRIGRPFFAATAALSGITVLMSAALFIAFPRLPHGWIGATRGGGDETMAGFGREVSLGEFGTTISPNPRIVFRVEFAAAPPQNSGTLHWRGRSFDRFDGVRWIRSRGIPPASPPPSWYRERWGSTMHSYQIFGGPPGAQLLFGLHPVYDVDSQAAIRPFMDRTGDIRYAGQSAPVYRVRSIMDRPSPAELRGDPATDLPAAGAYLQLPRVSSRMLQLADSLTRGQPTRYDKALAVQQWLQQNFRYTLELPATRAQTSLEYFLFERRAGHCEYFSTAMAILLRTVGIPTRNVNGFLGGEWNEGAGYLAVTGNQAHSWIEVWFPEWGWVTFDPTPAGTGAPVAGAGVDHSWGWPLRFWFDGVEHRWTKWVLFYDLDKQLGLFRDVSAAFSRPASAVRERQSGGMRQMAPWLLGVVGTVVLLWLLRGWRPAGAASPESQHFLALRRAYARGGYVSPDAAPLGLLDALQRSDAPGLGAAERLIGSYVRVRFGGERIGEEGRIEMQQALGEVRRALRNG